MTDPDLASHSSATAGIAAGEKYAIVALPRLPIDALNLPRDGELAPGLWFAQQLPFRLEQHWKDWIGTVRTEQITAAQLILMAKRDSHLPGVFDGENNTLMELAGRFYQGLQLATPIWVEGEVVRLTGANHEGTVDIRQMGTLTPPGGIRHGAVRPIGIATLRDAAKFVPILNGFPAKTFLRLCRALNVYFSGMESRDLRERLHQFARCIEGLILAEPGRTTAQFKSRTELFVGPKLQELMGVIYENRSAVEHMNDPILAAVNEDDRRRAFLEMALISEDIARYCLKNILLNPHLLQHYQDEARLSAFWSLEATNRRSLWGAPLDVEAIRKDLRKRRITAS